MDFGGGPFQPGVTILDQREVGFGGGSISTWAHSAMSYGFEECA